MSVSAMAAVWQLDTDVGMSERCLLAAMADHADDEGYCWPSLDLLVRKTGGSRSTVTRVRSQLIERGLIVRVGEDSAQASTAGRRWVAIPEGRRPALYRLAFMGSQIGTGPKSVRVPNRDGSQDDTGGVPNRDGRGVNGETPGVPDWDPNHQLNHQRTTTEPSESVGDAGASPDPAPDGWRDVLIDKHGPDIVAEAEALAEIMADKVRDRGYTANVTPTSKAWVLGMTRCITSATRANGDPERVATVIDMLFADDDTAEHDGFWSDQIRSPQKLYDKWDDFRAAVKRYRRDHAPRASRLERQQAQTMDAIDRIFAVAEPAAPLEIGR